jgi:hypothetical protein
MFLTFKYSQRKLLFENQFVLDTYRTCKQYFMSIK